MCGYTFVFNKGNENADATVYRHISQKCALKLNGYVCNFKNHHLPYNGKPRNVHTYLLIQITNLDT